MLGQLDTFIAFAVVILGVSLLITVLNQMVVAFFGLRGRELQWGLQTLLEQVDPALKKHAKTISCEILEHPLLSDSRWFHLRDGRRGAWTRAWRWASAVKVSELLNILRQLATVPKDQTPAEWQQQLAATLDAHDRQALDRIQKAHAAIATMSPTTIDKIDELAPQVAAKFRSACGDMELWFDSVMDRVSQRFATRMRMVTVAFSVVLAFLLHLDAYALLKDIDSNAQLKAALVTSVDGMIKRGDAILTKSFVEEAAATPELQKLAGVVPPRYEERSQAELKASMQKLASEAAAIRTALDAGGIRLIPDDTHSFWRREPLWGPHFFGVLAAAALLSLGAPFWFQVLKTAASLRPIVAGKEKEDRESRS